MTLFHVFALCLIALGAWMLWYFWRDTSEGPPEDREDIERFINAGEDELEGKSE